MPSSRASSAIAYTAFVVIAVVVLIGILVEGGTILLTLRAADEGLRAAAQAAGKAIETREENGYGVQALRETDGPDGVSALTAAQAQIDARGLSDSVHIDGLALVDNTVLAGATCRVPAVLGRVIGFSYYDFALTALADVGP